MCIKIMGLCDWYCQNIFLFKQIKSDRLIPSSFHSYGGLQSTLKLSLKQPRNAKFDDYDRKYHIFQGCFFQDTYIKGILLFCEDE